MTGIFEHAFWPLELVRGAEAQYIAEAEVQTPGYSAVDILAKTIKLIESLLMNYTRLFHH